MRVHRNISKGVTTVTVKFSESEFTSFEKCFPNCLDLFMYRAAILASRDFKFFSDVFFNEYFAPELFKVKEGI